MKLWSQLKDLAVHLYRFKAGETRTWAERATREQAALDDLRTHPGFDALLDTLEAEIRSIFLQMSQSENEDEALRLWRRWRGISESVKIMEKAVTLKARSEQAEHEASRQVELMKVDSLRRREALDAMMRKAHPVPR